MHKLTNPYYDLVLRILTIKHSYSAQNLVLRIWNKAFDKKRANAEFAADRDYTDYEKFGSILFCNSSFNSRIESANYAKQMELYISGKEADLSELDTSIKDYENERSKCRDFNP